VPGTAARSIRRENTMKPLVLLVVAVTGLAPPPPKANKPSNKDLIVGNWELVKTSQEGGIGSVVLHLEFTKDGKMLMRQVQGREKSLIYEAKYKVEGDKEDQMPYESITEGIDKKETLTIKTLTDKELVFEDPEGIVEEFRRLKDEDKK
jgi:uncharacterized protein (TIGR03066 family)